MSKFNDKIILKGGYVKTKIDNISEVNMEIGRGVGVHKPKKGKGSYRRHNKHKDKGLY